MESSSGYDSRCQQAVWCFLHLFSISHRLDFSLSVFPSRVSHPLHLPHFSLSLISRFRIPPLFSGATMSDVGEKTCPLCAEEMDLTDQHLKPCKCGYEICVWCWHHIMEMAEKDETEGRCPACRTPYDKEKIVGTAANCERLVSEMNMERKKSQKAKPKLSEGRKQLSSVRVIQRNLVYVVGLPLNLADEDLLQRKEYFAQYGKVLKVSISRTSAGSIQQFANNTCSVYIIYSKEEEAVRCIQSVHGFTLEGRPLRACFGTTKYCHAWLRNVPCTNPDCLYLHEIGSQEDSFTKDEIISAYTRVQQITGVTNNMQRRSGNVLPPPADEFCSNSCTVIGKPVVKSTANSSASNVRDSPPTSSSGRSGVPPSAASWGTYASNYPSSAGAPCSNGPSKHKPDPGIGSMAFSTAVLGITQSSTLANDVGKKLMLNEESHLKQRTNKMDSLENLKQSNVLNPQMNVSEISVTPLRAPASMESASCLPSSVETMDKKRKTRMPPNIAHYVDKHSNVSGLEKERNASTDGKVQSLYADIQSVGADKRLNTEPSKVIQPSGLCLDNLLLPVSPGSCQQDSDKFQEHSTSTVACKAANSVGGSASTEACDWRSDPITTAVQNMSSEIPSIFGNQRPRDATIDNQATLSSSSHLLHDLNQFRSQLHDANADDAINYYVDPPIINKKANENLATIASSASVVSNGCLENFISSNSSLCYTSMIPSEGNESQTGRLNSEAANVDSNPAFDMESNIISNILSLDLDTWDDCLTSPNLSKLWGEPDKPHGSLKLSSSCKAQNSNQSRFSFARQDEYTPQLFNAGPSFNSGQASMNNSFNHAFVEDREPHLHGIGNGFGFCYGNAEQSDKFSSVHSVVSSNKFSVSRAQISAPPGFSVPNRPPPPGFSPREKNEQIFNVNSGNQLLDTSSLLRNPFGASLCINKSGAGNIEFMDPAILAVGKGRPTTGGINNSGLDMQPIFHSQPASENEAKLQLLMQKSVTPHENLRYADIKDSFAPDDASGFTSRDFERLQASSMSSLPQFSLHQSRNAVMSNGHWDGWNEIQAGNGHLGSDLVLTFFWLEWDPIDGETDCLPHDSYSGMGLAFAWPPWAARWRIRLLSEATYLMPAGDVRCG
ncbi:hypothetical protein Nepgr_000666 [Nepenthes gracilis]|uniref:CCR4-NOT transcription complex subunit 4 n=1 Tax=Nepenthes gracilis TaxID=150966 RepID=A0AAD3P442_NEPGR|nr:hypothetical protein Nepgr_000666 [Nepenthes gracilis]